MDLQGSTVNPVDASGRITLREHQLDQLDGTVVITQGFDENLLMFSPEQWAKFVDGLGGGSLMDPDMDDLRRLFRGAAAQVQLDERGRMKIPESLREWANRKPGDSKALVLDIGTRWEIWEQGRFKEYMSERKAALKEFARRKFGSLAEGEAEASGQ